MSDPSITDLARRALDLFIVIMLTMAAEMRRNPSAMSPTISGILGSLSEGALTLGELADRAAVSAPTMSNTITMLEERGWVERFRSTEDRRLVYVRLTQTGSDVLHTARAELTAHIAHLLRTVAPEERAALTRSLDVLYAAFAAGIAQIDGDGAVASQHDDA